MDIRLHHIEQIKDALEAFDTVLLHNKRMEVHDLIQRRDVYRLAHNAAHDLESRIAADVLAFAAQKEYVAKLEAIWDAVSEAIENGVMPAGPAAQKVVEKCIAAEAVRDAISRGVEARMADARRQFYIDAELG